MENNFLSPHKAEALNKAIEDQKAGKNLVEASQTILRLTNEDRAGNLLLEKYQQGQPLSDGQKQELAGLLNQYGIALKKGSIAGVVLGAGVWLKNKLHERHRKK